MREYVFTIALKITMNDPPRWVRHPTNVQIYFHKKWHWQNGKCVLRKLHSTIDFFLSSAADLVWLLTKADRETTPTAAVNRTHISHWLEDAVWHVLPKQTWARQLLSDDLLVTVARNIKANNQSLARSRGNFPRVLCIVFGQPELTAIIYSHHYKLFFSKWTRVT